MRRLRVLLVPLAALVAFLAAAPVHAAGGGVTLAHIKLSGELDESPTAPDPLTGSAGENFKSKLDRIKKAKADKSIQGLYLHIDNAAIGWGKLDELTRALADFRKSGKKVFAYLDSADTKDYLLALACDEVCLPESGTLMLTGLRAEVTFFKDLFDKIGVKADLLAMGEAKTAAEPFTRTSLTDASRKQLKGVLDDHFDNDLVARIVKARPAKKFTKEQVEKIIDEGPYTAKQALKLGLIDRVAYADTFQDDLKKVLDAKEVTVVKNYGQAKSEEIDLGSLTGILKLLSAMSGPKTPASSTKPKVAVIYAVGTITTGKGGLSLLGLQSVGSDTIIEAIRQAEEDKTVKAIVLRVDSPGGSALASDLMWNELVKCKKPVVASMSDVAASGGYYISMGAKKIYAEPGTLTGSIGVVGGKLAVGGLYENVGLKTEVLSRGANAGILSIQRPFSDSERKAMTALMADIYDQFLDKALEGRKRAGKKMTRDELVKLAGGRVWTGRQAKENGLVDELGTLDDAIADAWKLAEMPADKEPELLILPKPRSLLDSLMSSDRDTKAVELRLAPLLREMPELKRKLGPAESLLRLRGESVWLVSPYGVEVR
jgi:protease-4